MWVLESVSVPNKEAEGRYYLVSGRYTIGRLQNECDLYCQHDSISRKHAEIAVATASKSSQPPQHASLKGVSHFTKHFIERLYISLTKVFAFSKMIQIKPQMHKAQCNKLYINCAHSI